MVRDQLGHAARGNFLKWVCFGAPGYNEMVGNWVRERIGLEWGWPGSYTISLWDDCEILAAVVYESFDKVSVQCHIAGAHGSRWMTRRYLNAIFGYPFEHLKVRRITVCVASGNSESRALVEHMGFKQEGVVRHAAPDQSDLILYGMLREECPPHFLEMKNG